MRFELQESKAKELVKLVYFGFYVLRCESTNDDWKNYEPLMEGFVKEYVKNTREWKEQVQGVKEEVAERRLSEAVGDCIEAAHEEAYCVVERLEKAALSFALSQALADLRFPRKEGSENLINNILAEEFYDDELDKSGVKIVRLEIPGGEERLGKLLRKARKE